MISIWKTSRIPEGKCLHWSHPNDSVPNEAFFLQPSGGSWARHGRGRKPPCWKAQPSVKGDFTLWMPVIRHEHQGTVKLSIERTDKQATKQPIKQWTNCSRNWFIDWLIDGLNESCGKADRQPKIVVIGYMIYHIAEIRYLIFIISGVESDQPGNWNGTPDSTLTWEPKFVYHCKFILTHGLHLINKF